MDWESDPDWIAYRDRVKADLIPMIKNSGVTVSLLPEGEVDVKFAVELGLMIMLDKPIIVVVPPGVSMPQKLALVADAIVEGPVGGPHFPERLKAAIEQTTGQEM